MAIAVLNSADLGSDTSGTFTVSFDSGGGSNRLLIVTCFTNGTSATCAYGGDAMTELGTKQDCTGGSNYFTYTWWMIAPATGANNVVISGSSSYCRAVAASYEGVAQTGQPDSSANTGTQVTATITKSVTTTADNCWLIIGGGANNGSVSAGANTTIRAVHANFVFIADSNGAKTPAGSYSLAVTSSFGANENWGWNMASFKPAVAAGPTNLKTYNTNAKANIKTINTNAIANVKTLNTNA